jgi:hypothetical protein
MIGLLQQAVATGIGFRVPPAVVGRALRNGRRQVGLARFLRAGGVELVPLDGDSARACGEICGHTGTTDVIDASVAIVARERRDVIVTSDPEDLLRLDPGASVVRI